MNTETILKTSAFLTAWNMVSHFGLKKQAVQEEIKVVATLSTFATIIGDTQILYRGRFSCQSACLDPKIIVSF